MATVLITGASRGIGKSLALAFNDVGWDVIAGCRNPKHFDGPDSITIIELDVSNQAHVDALNNVVDRPIDVLINNAALYDVAAGVGGALDDKPVFSRLEDLTPLFVVNAVAPRVVTETLLHKLRAGRRKLVITVSSENMSTIATADDYAAQHWPYSASKAATNFAMSTLSKVIPDITSVLLSPGWVKTDMGGPSAPLDPDDVAREIVEMVVSEADALADGAFIDSKGRLLQL